MEYEKFMRALNYQEAEVNWNNVPASAKDCICIPWDEWHNKIERLIDYYDED